MVIVVGVLMVLSGTGAQTKHDDVGPPPATSLRAALDQLRGEAEQALEMQMLPRSGATFASDFPHELSPDELGARLVEPFDSDPFIDAYMRWQLTSFDPPLPELSGPAFERLARTLPALQPNPRGEQRLLAQINRAVAAGTLRERDVAQLETLLQELGQRTSQMADLNVPTLALRDWLVERVRDDAVRDITLTMERVTALVDAGWPTEPAKAELQRVLSEHQRKRSFTDEQRRLIARKLERMVGKERPLLIFARIEDGVVQANFGATGVYDPEVREWLKLLERA